MSNQTKIIISKGTSDRSVSSSQQVRIGGSPAEPSGRRSRREIDLVFVIDTTGSMSDKIKGLLDTCARFVDEFASLQLQHRIAVMAFGDLKVPGDKITVTSFSENIEIMKRSLANIPRYSGGGNVGESSFEAMERASRLEFRPTAVKVLLLITDEPAHQDAHSVGDILGRMREREFMVFVVSPRIKYFQDMAALNAGKWYPIAADTDFTDLLRMFDDIAKTVSNRVDETHRLAAGSVARYLQLNPPS